MARNRRPWFGPSGIERPCLGGGAAQPGVLQTKLAALVAAEDRAVREICYWLTELGRIHRRKQGRSFGLYPDRPKGSRTGGSPPSSSLPPRRGTTPGGEAEMTAIRWTT